MTPPRTTAGRGQDRPQIRPLALGGKSPAWSRPAVDPEPRQPYGPGAICDTCGHFAGRHDEKGCQGMKNDYDCHCAPKKKDCKVFMWAGTAWPRPWLPAPEGLTRGTP